VEGSNVAVIVMKVPAHRYNLGGHDSSSSSAFGSFRSAVSNPHVDSNLVAVIQTLQTWYGFGRIEYTWKQFQSVC